MIFKILLKLFEFGISIFMFVGLGRIKENYFFRRQFNIYKSIWNLIVIVIFIGLVKIDFV